MPIIFAILDAESGRKELSHLARPRKCRRVCDYPRTLAFSPEESGACQPPVILTVDEYEAIRLIDKEGLSQEQCGKQMHGDALICGGIGGGAQQALAAAGIWLYAGVTGSADAAAQALAEGKLACNANATCSHHGEHHEGSCGSHGCGHHSCGEK